MTILMKISLIYEFISVKNGYIEEQFKSEKIFGVPLKILHVPLGVRVPQVGNRWFKLFRM